jgi:hypothetical protein
MRSISDDTQQYKDLVVLKRAAQVLRGGRDYFAKAVAHVRSPLRSGMLRLWKEQLHCLPDAADSSGCELHLTGLPGPHLVEALISDEQHHSDRLTDYGMTAVEAIDCQPPRVGRRAKTHQSGL